MPRRFARPAPRARLVLLLASTVAGACAPRPPQPRPPERLDSRMDSIAPAHPRANPTPAPLPSTIQTPTPPPQDVAPGPALREVFPFVRVDPAAGLVELDGEVPIDPHDPKTPRVYLETLVCAPDTKEHESLVLTRAKPSHVHAAMLLAGLVPGKPGLWDWSGKTLRAVAPSGPRVRVEFAWSRDGTPFADDPAQWVLDLRTNRTLRELEPEEGLVFAGSIQSDKTGAYWADSEGTIIGLAAFGGETIAWTRMHSPESNVEEPRFVAHAARVPPRGTPVTVRITREPVPLPGR